MQCVVVEAGVRSSGVCSWASFIFDIYCINYIQVDVDSDCFLFADDSLLIQEVSSPISTACTLNNDLNATVFNHGQHNFFFRSKNAWGQKLFVICQCYSHFVQHA